MFKFNMKTLEEIDKDLNENEGENCTQAELLMYLSSISGAPEETIEANLSLIEMGKKDCICCKNCYYFWSYNNQCEDKLEPIDIGTCKMTGKQTNWENCCENYKEI